MIPRTLDDFKGVSRQSGAQINFKDCPVCGSDQYKVYVNPETGGWFCHAGGHGAGGKIEIGTPSHVNQTQTTLLQMLDAHKLKKPDVRWPEATMPPYVGLSHQAERYLLKRGLTHTMIRKMGIVEEQNRYRILIPYFDDEGKLVYYTGRRYSDNLGNGPKYMTMYGKHPLYVPRREVLRPKIVLVEGVFDAIAIAQHTDCHAIALGGKSLPSYLRKDLKKEVQRAIIEVGVKPILYVMLDGDAQVSTIKLCNTLPPLPIANLLAVTLHNGYDPASLPIDELRSALDE